MDSPLAEGSPESLVDLGPDAHAVSERRGAGRHHHELLEVDRVVGVSTPVQHVHHRHRDQLRRTGVLGACCRIELGEVVVQRLARIGRRRPGGGQRDPEDRVGAEAALVRRPVELDHRPVERRLLGGSRTPDRLRDLPVHICDGLGDSLSAPEVSSVAKLDGLELAGGGSRGNDREAASARVEHDLDLDRRVAPRVEHLPAVDVLDRRHGGGKPTGRPYSASSTRRRVAWRRATRDRRPAAARRRRPRATARPPSARPRRAPRDPPTALGLLALRISLRVDPAQHLAGVEQGGQVLGQPLEWLAVAGALDLALDLLPLGQHLARCSHLTGRAVARPLITGAVDVRVAADQFGGAGLGDCRQITLAALLEQQREEEHLEEDIAELVDHRLRVVARGGIGQLVGLLDRVRDDRAGVLFAVPGALPAQPPGHLIEVLERLQVPRRCRAPSHYGVRPGIAMLPAPAVVPSPGGCGPCGAPPVTGTNGLKDPGAPGVGPVPLHCN